MKSNMLKLNDDNDKTQFIVFKSNRNMKMFAGESIQVGYTAVEEISSKVKKFGVIFDQSLSMQTHTNTVARSVCYPCAELREFVVS